MINRREALQGLALSPLVASAPGALAGIAGLLKERETVFTLATMQGMVDRPFRVRSEAASADLQLVRVEEREGKCPEPALEQFHVLFRSTVTDLPAGLYDMAAASGNGPVSGLVYIEPSMAVEGSEGFYSTTVCNFRTA